jgi:2-methylisocitrate lyase-like PEP mutase family enzyme
MACVRRISAALQMRILLAERDIVVAPGGYDGLTAKLIEEAGFDAIYCTGGGISRSRGLPDLGYTTLTELVERISAMTEASLLPMIVDADAGFGNVLTLQRAVRLLSRSGAAGLHLEDLEIPRRHKGFQNNIIGPMEMEGRLKAALAARDDPNFLIIARTDVLRALGIDEAIERARRYADAGADMVYVEFINSRAEMEHNIARQVTAPKLISLNNGENECVHASELAEMGYKLLTLPADPQLAAIAAIRRLLAYIKQQGTSVGFDEIATFAQREALVDTSRHTSVEDTYLP